LEAGVPLAAIGVEDPEGRPPARRAGSVASHHHLRSLADDVTPEADPRLASELQPDTRGLADGACDAGAQVGWLEDRDRDLGPSGEGRQPAEPIGHAAALAAPPRDALRQVDDEQVHGPAGQQRAGDRDPLVHIGRGHDDEPLGLHTAGDGLDGIEGRGEIQPGDDRARCLGFRGEPQGDGRPAARQVTPKRDAHAPRQAARAEDRVEGGEPGREDPSRIGLRARSVSDIDVVVAQWHRRQRERADHGAGLAAAVCAPLPESRGSGRAPLRPQGREGRRHVRGECRHGLSIEQMFE
jgi:hypothetical protein